MHCTILLGNYIDCRILILSSLGAQNEYFSSFTEYSIERIYHLFLVHSQVDRQLGCFYFLATMNNAAMNIYEQVFV